MSTKPNRKARRRHLQWRADAARMFTIIDDVPMSIADIVASMEEAERREWLRRTYPRHEADAVTDRR